MSDRGRAPPTHLLLCNSAQLAFSPALVIKSNTSSFLAARFPQEVRGEVSFVWPEAISRVSTRDGFVEAAPGENFSHLAGMQSGWERVYKAQSLRGPNCAHAGLLRSDHVFLMRLAGSPLVSGREDQALFGLFLPLSTVWLEE